MENPSTQPGMLEQSCDGPTLTLTAAEIASLFPATQILRTHRASWSQQAREGQAGEEEESTVRKMLPLERCCNKDKMLQMSTGYHRIPEKPHSFSAAEPFIHKLVFLPSVFRLLQIISVLPELH